MNKLIGVGLAVALVTGTALGQPFNARGAFNGWGEAPMTDDGDGSHSVTIGGLNPGDRHEFKIAQNDWASSWPGSNSKTIVNAAGQITLHFIPGAIADGWNPAADRVGYSDPMQFGWEIQGAFNNWDEGVDTAARQMTNQGNGLYSVDYTIANPGGYDFKFRESGNWDVAIGSDFGNSASNANVTTANPNEIVRFELDLPNGRWRTSVVPEPASAAILGLGSMLILRGTWRRRRRGE